MNKIRFLFLQILFIGVPLIYAWLYIPGISINLADVIHFILPDFRWSGFESVKVLFFLSITSVIFLMTLIQDKNSTIRLPESLMISSLVFFVWSVGSYTLNHGVNPYFFSGNLEKAHGWFFYLALFILFWILHSLQAHEKRKLFLMTFIGFFGVVLYSFFQRIGFDPLRELYNSRLDPWRIFSTLGNPNYLAGYVLVLLPLLRVYRFKNEFSLQENLWEICVWIVSGTLIYWSGSYLAWILFAGYVGYVIITYVLTEKKHRDIFWILFVLFTVVGIWWIWHDYSSEILAAQKMKGFIARWYLWKTGIAALTHDVWHFLFGFGPDGFLPISAEFRHPLLSIYEDPAYRIDRSHNVFIDFALHFGVPITLAFLWMILQNVSKFSHDKKIALLLFALYFSFNIPVLVNILPLVLIFASLEK